MKKHNGNYLTTHILFQIDFELIMVANPDRFQIIFLGSSINNNSITFIVENQHIKKR